MTHGLLKIFVLSGLFVLLAGCTASQDAPLASPTATRSFGSVTVTAPQWGHRTKTTGCMAAGVNADPGCTPGDIFPTATAAVICVPGYSSGVRNVPQSEKDQAYTAYGIARHLAGQYEIDHYVPLELGGNNDPSNLWPEAASPVPGFHQKDQEENALHDLVCHGKIALSEAQREIATNWLAAYDRDVLHKGEHGKSD